MQEPELTFPPEVAALVRARYAEADVILEYGSGGSTVLAARLGKQVFSVESDAAWARGISDFLDRNGLGASVRLHPCDIGPTGEWGMPTDLALRRLPSFLGYASSVWKRPDFRAPDLILLDGRFRIGCLLACLARIDRPTPILFDDYADRDWYRVAEDFVRPVTLVGRMAVFEARPTRFSWASLPERLRLSRVAL